MKDEERDILRKTILQTLMKGYVHYTDLEKKICATCYLWATRNTFKSQLDYLLRNGFIERVSRGVYGITEKGRKYGELLLS